MKEDFGYYRGNLHFHSITGRSGYLPKWWRYANEIEIQSFDPPIQEILPKKRGRPKIK